MLLTPGPRLAEGSFAEKSRLSRPAWLGHSANDLEPYADQVSDGAASGRVRHENEPATEDVAGMVITALQERLGLDAAAAEAIVSGLRRRGPSQDAFAVYLDLNHWIALAKAQVGHRDGARFAACLDLLVKAVDSGKVILPLGLTHYVEVANITDVRQRADIANAMAELSGFTTLAARKHRLRCEVAQALHQRLGLPLSPSACSRSAADSPSWVSAKCRSWCKVAPPEAVENRAAAGPARGVQVGGGQVRQAYTGGKIMIVPSL